MIKILKFISNIILVLFTITFIITLIPFAILILLIESLIDFFDERRNGHDLY